MSASCATKVSSTWRFPIRYCLLAEVLVPLPDRHGSETLRWLEGRCARQPSAAPASIGGFADRLEETVRADPEAGA